jgi:hypothetical protein
VVDCSLLIDCHLGALISFLTSAFEVQNQKKYRADPAKHNDKRRQEETPAYRDHNTSGRGRRIVTSITLACIRDPVRSWWQTVYNK